jgi:hypothetical protein
MGGKGLLWVTIGYRRHENKAQKAPAAQGLEHCKRDSTAPADVKS